MSERGEAKAEGNMARLRRLLSPGEIGSPLMEEPDLLVSGVSGA